MKHTISLLLLLSVALGCGKTPDPTPAVEPPTAEPTYELDPAKHFVTKSALKGTLGGKPFVPERIELDGNQLTFRQGDSLNPDLRLIVSWNDPPTPDKEQKIVVRPDQKPGEGPVIFCDLKQPDKTLKNERFDTGYALTLIVQPRQGGTVKGMIYLCLPGAEKAMIAGEFSAMYDRPVTSPPTANDQPFITGAILHKGKPKQILTIGYVRLPAPGVEPLYDDQSIGLTDNGTEVLGAVRSYQYKPRSATIRPGPEGKGVEYDLTKLPPGKYVVAARLDGVPAAWKVIDVSAATQATLPLDISERNGGSVALHVSGNEMAFQVQLIPAGIAAEDDSGAGESYLGWILGTIAEMKNGKGTIANVPPGEYTATARTGANRYAAKVTVKAGETATVELIPIP